MDTNLQAAQDSAVRVADQCGLPQTIYRNADSGGWWHTNALAPLLQKSEVSVTVLPFRYFN